MGEGEVGEGQVSGAGALPPILASSRVWPKQWISLPKPGEAGVWERLRVLVWVERSMAVRQWLVQVQMALIQVQVQVRMARIRVQVQMAADTCGRGTQRGMTRETNFMPAMVVT